VALGVTNAQHQLVPAMSRKWKQINKFVEIFAHALSQSQLATAPLVKVADFGAGRGYLTFAVHDWLQRRAGVQAQVTGVELRIDLVDEAEATIAKLGLQGLKFEAGDVRTFEAGAMNVMIALHACDTATDHAIHLGLQAGADIILCSPCCHKQLRPQLLSPHPLRPVFQHGIHAEQQAEMLTDSLRALLLEASGYDTQVFEFIALEHTRKNKMILAIKRKAQRPSEAAWAQVDELKRYFGIREQALETLLLAERRS
jgi:Methyltransferase domain